MDGGRAFCKCSLVHTSLTCEDKFMDTPDDHGIIPFSRQPIHPIMTIKAKHVPAFFANTCKQLVNCTTHRLFKQANRGLYSGERVRHGYYRTEMRNKVPRTWSPNVHRVLLFSSSVGKKFRVKVTKRTLNRVDHDG